MSLFLSILTTRIPEKSVLFYTVFLSLIAIFIYPFSLASSG